MVILLRVSFWWQSDRTTPAPGWLSVFTVTVERLLQDSCRNKGLVVFGGFAVLVRPHGLTQAVDEFRRSVASVAEHAREPVNCRRGLPPCLAPR